MNQVCGRCEVRTGQNTPWSMVLPGGGRCGVQQSHETKSVNQKLHFNCQKHVSQFPQLFFLTVTQHDMQIPISLDGNKQNFVKL